MRAKLLIAFALIIALACGKARPIEAVEFEFDWPQTNTDGSNLTDLAGAQVYICAASPCTKAGTKGPAVPAPAPDPPTGAIGFFSLTSGTGFVSVTAIDATGNESAPSNTIPFEAIPPSVPTLRRR